MDAERINRIAAGLTAEVDKKLVLEGVVKAAEKAEKDAEQAKKSMDSLDAEIMPENNPLWKNMRKLTTEASDGIVIIH